MEQPKPDETGTCMANYSFLSDEAKVHLGESFKRFLLLVMWGWEQLNYSNQLGLTRVWKLWS